MNSKLSKTILTVGLLSLASLSHAGVGEIAAGVDLNDAKTGIVAVGVAVGGFLAIGIGVRAVLGMMKRL
ncbi:hypothetical protein A6B39_04290 [Mannheimia granulomatis]|uniref:hypothetical protein n=1 Tax=Mannheimia granulomatis TaxID=85402 RepID=UPI00159EA73A|nr:hypothetical protein [Mannheimia granulomatis]QLB14725.1 hypothetical protein A6B39_04290 [Mannheimia granulomatis]